MSVNRVAKSFDHVRAGRRNAAVMAATAAAVGALFVLPGSSSRATSALGAAGQPAAAGVVTRPASPTPSAAAGRVTTTVVNGTAADTPYGPVQVQITVRAGHLVGATAIVFPQGSGQDQAINGYAIPQLQQETLAAQSARIDSVSGATYTSAGYTQSLQAALDAAHL